MRLKEGEVLNRDSKMKKKILFVTDQPKALRGLGRVLAPLRSQWQMDFVQTDSEALTKLAGCSYDAVATDVAGAQGQRLLERVGKLYPGVVRILLTGHSDSDRVLESLGAAHFILSKPFEAQKLKIILERAFSMRALLADQALIKLISRIDSLPSVPSLYHEVVLEAQSPNGSLAKVADIISKDVSMSAKLLQVVNSALFGFPGQVSSILRAVSLLGIENIKALILSLKIFTCCLPKNIPGYSLSGLWAHSLAVALSARTIATQEGLAQSKIDEAFLAGMLHDVGKIVLIDKLPNECLKISELAKTSGCDLHVAENEILGVTHAQLGAYLMTIWGLSQSTVEAIAYHHCPGRSSEQTFGPLTAVHLADALEHSGAGGKEDKGLDVEYLKNIGIYEND
jgi:HD-like signal output (HDOD) protein/ActR/RegA family two-component response regulator